MRVEDLIKFSLKGLLFLIFFKIKFFIFKDLIFVSEIIFGLIIFVVPSARLELALPKGQGF